MGIIFFNKNKIKKENRLFPVGSLVFLSYRLLLFEMEKDFPLIGSE